MTNLLDIENLSIGFQDHKSREDAVINLYFTIKEAERLGIVGESGSGKTLTALSILRLLKEGAQVKADGLRYQGQDLLNMSEKELQRLRGREIGMVFQEPMTALNPLMRIGEQIQEVLENHNYPDDHKERVLTVMRRVGLPRVEDLYEQYPHELSGGMLQRAMIAMAMAMRPKLLIADEPTTALDVTISKQILDLMRRLNERYQTAILLISHDLGVIKSLCENVIVLYLGYIMEKGPVDTIFYSPRHPYTHGLIASLPRGDKHSQELYNIPGRVPPLSQRPGGCPFHTRCFRATDRCRAELPALERLEDRWIRCFHPLEVSP